MNHSLINLKETQRQFNKEGFISGISVFTPEQCSVIVDHDRYGKPPKPKTWEKGKAASDRFLYDISTRPQLLNILKALLGENIVLWGSAIIHREIGQDHPWHTDLETSASDIRSASIWIGLKNTSKNSSLTLVSRSHRLGKSIQQVAIEKNTKRETATSDKVEKWAKEYDNQAKIIQPDVSDGEAIFFDGHLWHSSRNKNTDGCRTTLLLQYAASEGAIRIPDYNRDWSEWPFRFKDKPRPPVLLVSGTAEYRTNHITAAPKTTSAQTPGNSKSTKLVNKNHFQSFPMPYAEDNEKRWKPYPVFHGRTDKLQAITCHISVLSAGYSPHLPHAHLDEEILMVLDGEAELIIPENPDSPEPRIEKVQEGSFIYYPSYQHHTIRNSGNKPVTYLMFKWRSPALETIETLPCKLFHYSNLINCRTEKPFTAHLLSEQATAFLDNLHSHLTLLKPGAGYKAHIDNYDLALVLLKGKIKINGQVIKNKGLAFIPGGNRHGMKNIGNDIAHYLIFEFHARKTESLTIKAPFSLNIINYKNKIPVNIYRHFKIPRKIIKNLILRRM